MLGLTFKRDSDDVRDSLSFKLVRLLERELADVARHDPFVAGATRVRSRRRWPAPTPWWWPPTTRSYDGLLPQRVAAPTRCWSIPGT